MVFATILMLLALTSCTSEVIKENLDNEWQSNSVKSEIAAVEEILLAGTKENVLKDYPNAI